MGLFKNNYNSKSLGVTLPTAYAVLNELVLKGNNCRAIFVIQKDRNSTTSLKPVDKVEISFVWDRKTDLAKMAYEKSKTQKIKTYDYEKINEQGYPQEIETDGVLNGWFDDYV